jgi:hypothetical protein
VSCSGRHGRAHALGRALKMQCLVCGRRWSMSGPTD